VSARPTTIHPAAKYTVKSMKKITSQLQRPVTFLQKNGSGTQLKRVWNTTNSEQI